MKPFEDAAFGKGSTGHVPAHLERDDARHIRHERKRDEVVHDLDVLSIRVRYADRGVGQLPRLAAGIALFDLVDTALDLAYVLEVIVEPV